MSKTLNEMVHTIVDYYGSITRAADEIGVHYNTLDRLLKDETAIAQAGTMEKIEAIYDGIPVEEEEPEEEEAEEKITKLEIGKTYEIKVPKNGAQSKVMTLIRGTVKGEYRQFYHLSDNGKNITVLKADLINDRTTVREIDEPAEEMDVEYVPAVEEPTEEEITEEEAMEEAPVIMGDTLNEKLRSCLYIIELCDIKIDAAEEAKKQKAAVLPIMDQLYKEFRG